MEHSFYSGMLPGAVAKLYTDEELKVNLKTAAIWSEARYIFQKAVKIDADYNRIQLQNGEYVQYDVLSVNIGSVTRSSFKIPGIWDFSLTTRPINHLLFKIQ